MDFLGNVSYKDDVPVLKQQEIEEIAYMVLKDTQPDCLSRCEPIPVERIMEKAFGLRIEPLMMTPDGSILGQTYFQDMQDQFCVPHSLSYGWMTTSIQRKTVVIDSFLYENEQQRLAFTLAHELGHWVLHQRFYTESEQAAARTRVFRDNHTCYLPRTPVEWTEWQADCFASCFLLPRVHVRQVTKDYLKEIGQHYSRLLNFSDRNARAGFIALSERLAKTMGVSRDCARIRLETLFSVHYPTH